MLLPWRPLSLRFRNEQMEQAYLGGRRPFLIRRGRMLSYLHLLASCCSALLWVASQGYDREKFPTDMAYFSTAVQFLGHATLIIVLVTLLLVFKLREATLAARNPLLLEVFLVVAVFCSMSMGIFLSPTRFAKLHGYELFEVFGDAYDSDSSVLLTIDVFITGCHLGLPIRWMVMAPLELAAILLYALVVLTVGSEEPTMHICYNLIVLVSLVVASAFGKRSAEIDERRTFLSVINEKARRCEAEFQLSQVAEGGGEHVSARKSERSENRSENRSEAVTDKSGAIFDPLFEKSVDKGMQLERVAAMGDSEHWRIPASEVRLLSEDALGRGGFGSVQRAIFCGMLVAVKCPHLELGSVKVPDLCNELRVLRHLRHPHIVTAHGAVVLPEQQQIYLVLELIEGTNLTAFLIPPDPDDRPSNLARYQVMLGVCRALLYMHTRVPHIVHGDLKGGNIMVETTRKGAFPKVLDFGLSRVMHGHTRALGGTLAWIAPEVIDRAPVRCSADVYSFGRVLAFVATGEPPMRHMSYNMVLRALQKRRPPLPSWPEDCAFGPGCRPLVQACLHPSQERRPRIEQVHKVLLGLCRELSPLWADTDLQEVRDLAEALDTNPSMDLRELCPTPHQKGADSKLASLPEEEVLTPQTQAPGSTLASTDSASPATLPPAASTAGGSSSEQRRRRRRRVPYAQLPETSRAAMQSTMLQTFRRWNSSELPRCCCERHAWFRLGQEICAKALASGCVGGPVHQPLPQEPQQCGNCGVLQMGGEQCELCGWEREEASETSSQQGEVEGASSVTTGCSTRLSV